jgi:hypothetical protein
MKNIPIIILCLFSINAQDQLNGIPENILNALENKDELYGQKIPPIEAMKFEPMMNETRLRPLSVLAPNCSIRTGSKSSHWAWTSNHPFVVGGGGRSVYYYVPFTPIFSAGGNPTVEVQLKALDTDHQRNLRINASVPFVSIYGFVIKIDTWADTKVYMVHYSYIAHRDCN